MNKNLLPIISCVGVVATAVATYIKHDDIEKAAKRLENEKSYKREAVVLFLKEAAMPIIFGTATIASIAIQNKVSAKRLAAATTAASAASSRFMNYRDKVRKEFGKEADKHIMTEIAKEDWGCQPALPISKNDTDELFFEPIGGRWFYAKPSRVSEAMYHVNRNLQLRGDSYVNEFYDFIGIKTDKKLDYIGWDAGYFLEELGICPWIDFRVKDGLEDGRPYYIIDYDWSPIDVNEFQER